jgi:GTP-binding protein Era
VPESPALYPQDSVAEAPERFFVSEIIRRQVFLQYRQEVPYGVAVEVVAYKERPRAKDFIEAHILLEREQQRGILLGRGGSAIKALATAARLEIEEFLGRPVYLELSVKVAEGWRKDPAMLERLGY